VRRWRAGVLLLAKHLESQRRCQIPIAGCCGITSLQVLRSREYTRPNAAPSSPLYLNSLGLPPLLDNLITALEPKQSVSPQDHCDPAQGRYEGAAKAAVEPHLQSERGIHGLIVDGQLKAPARESLHADALRVLLSLCFTSSWPQCISW
jgi:hypothetical protein